MILYEDRGYIYIDSHIYTWICLKGLPKQKHQQKLWIHQIMDFPSGEKRNTIKQTQVYIEDGGIFGIIRVCSSHLYLFSWWILDTWQKKMLISTFDHW